MIEAVMYVALGFCTAGLIGLAILPAFYRRAARLTEEALRAVNPSSYAEVRAAQDQARARHAIELRRVERQLDGEREKAARHHLDASKLRTEIEELNRTHQSRISGLETRIGELLGDQQAVDLLTAEVKTLKQKLADSEKTLTESWKDQPGVKSADADRASTETRDWVPEADTMALATITGLEAEVATLKAKLVKYEPTVTTEIEAARTEAKKTRLAELEAQLVDTEAKYVSAQAEVTRLSLMLNASEHHEADLQKDLTEKLEGLTRENAQQSSDLTTKERALSRLSGQVEKLQRDLAETPALKNLREDFRALASRIASADTVSVSPESEPSSKATPMPADGTAKPAASVSRKGKRTQRVIVNANKAKKPASVNGGAAQAAGPAEATTPHKTTEIASAAEALVSRIVASSRKTTDEDNAEPVEPDSSGASETTSDISEKPQTKSAKQKKKDVA